MKFLLEHLRTHVDMPESAREARELLDDVGLEVKSVDATELGTVFNIEILANRGDHYSYQGVAREVSGRTGAQLRYPRLKKLESERADETRVRIESPLCLVYTATELFVPEKIGPLPASVLAPLTAADIHSIDAAVDASNLTNFDIGQPTHAFDADTIDGPITVRTSRKGEQAWMLFTDGPAEIPEGTLVIADNSKILGIAGVIGCVESGVTPSTRRILLESACFDPVAVRIASRQLNQNTDAAARFMRGGDPTAPPLGAARVAYLLEQNAGYRAGTIWTAGEWKNPMRTIEADVARVNRFTGANVSHLEMAERLTRYGFTVEVVTVLSGAPGSPARRVLPSNAGLESPALQREPRADGEGSRNGGRSAQHDGTLLVTVPPHRLWDVNFEADLAEELLKSVGYNATPVTLPHIALGALPSHAENVMERASEVLVAEGFYEIFTDSFYGRGVRDRLGVSEGDPLWAHVEMQNSIERNYSLMRNNTIAQALDALATNVNQKLANLKIYEWARIYLPDMSEQGLLWGLANGRDRGPFWADKGRPADAIHLKGILEQLRLELRVDLRVGDASAHRLARFFHPGRCAGVWLGERIAGIFGELHPLLLQRFDIKRQRPVYFEIETDALFAAPISRTYSDPPSRQPVVRNVAYAIPIGITAASVREALQSAAPEFLREIRIVDWFEAARAVTFEIEYLSEQALTGEVMNAATEAMMRAVSERFGDKVTQRA